MVADRADVLVRQRKGVGRRVGLDSELHPARGSAIRSGDDGGAKPQAHRGVRDIPLPSAPRDAPAAFEQEAVPGRDLVGGHQVERRHVERAHGDPVAAVRHVEQQRAVGACRIDRDEEGGVAAEAHLPVRGALRAVEIDDARVGRMSRIHRIVRDGVDALVRPGLSERPAFLERLAPLDLQPCQCHSCPPPAMRTRSPPGECPGSTRGAAWRSMFPQRRGTRGRPPCVEPFTPLPGPT